MKELKKITASFLGKTACILFPESTSAPGFFAQKIYPDLLTDLLSHNGNSPVFITGTNGKSTTAGFLSSIYRSWGQPLIHNRSGANLQSGLLTALLREQKDFSKKLPLLEIDEAVLRRVSNRIPAKRILVTNFFRDQLDRFGEMNTTIKMVQEGLNFTDDGLLVANADDPNVCKLNYKNKLTYGFGAEVWASENLPEIFSAELGHCPVCDSELKYKVQWMGQLGDFYCENCGYQKAEPDIKVLSCSMNPEFSEIEVSFPNDTNALFKIPLAGLFNVYNALGAIATAFSCGIPLQNIQDGIAEYKTLFGRSQKVKYKTKELRLLLIKNPIGASEVLRLIQSDKNAKVLVAVNDNYADGRDISWLWDAHFEYLSEVQGPIYTAGTRNTDIAVRLKYGGVKKMKIFEDLKTALDDFCDSATISDNLYVLPTYTVLMELTKYLHLNKNQ
jgi:UDP-N-acetylmuramyl tripeptide synthase